MTAWKDKLFFKNTLMPNKDGTESIKLSIKVVGRVRKDKKKTGIPIGKFFEQAAEEKLKQQSLKK